MLSGDRRRVVLLVATVVAALLVVGVAVALAKSQRDARRTLEERFVGGTGTAAALVQTIVGQAYASDAQIAERSLAGRDLRDADVRRVAPRLGGDSIVVIDASRRVTAGAPARATLAAGGDEHLRQALAGRPAISGAL